MHVLVLCDDRWHPAGVPKAGLAPLVQCGFEFDCIENAQDWSPERMAAYPLVLLTKSNNVSSTDETPWMTAETQTAFKEYVSRGNGLLAVHSGLAGYQQTPVLRALLGGVFTHHPAQCPVTVQPEAGHALAVNASPFTLTDEHYFIEMERDDPQISGFLTTASEHGVQPGGWTRSEGKGRVCTLTPGHNLEVWLQPSFQTLLINSLQWCAAESPTRRV